MCVFGQGKNRVWKWFDDRTGKWSVYNDSNNKTIDDAFVEGENIVKFSASRRRYTVNFSTLVQVNDETGNRRAVMLAIPKPKNETNNSDGDKTEKDSEEETKSACSTSDDVT